MAGRTCKPDSDLKRLWQVLLPNTPFPACGTPETPDATADHSAASVVRPSDEWRSIRSK
jgi:hypothetical protein